MVLTFLVVIQPVNANEQVTIDYGVYWNEACTIPCEDVDWGPCYPNSWTVKTIYIRNEGGCFESYVITVEEPDPPELFTIYGIRFYWNVPTQDYELRGCELENPIQPWDAVKTVTIVIYVHPNIEALNITAFTFNIKLEVSMACDIRGPIPPNYLPDDVVDILDYAWVGKEYGTEYDPWMREDVNRDGKVTMHDGLRIMAFGNHYVASSYYVEEDLNQDRHVNEIDYMLWQIKHGTEYDEGYLRADLNHDGIIDILDFAAVGADYGKHL